IRAHHDVPIERGASVLRTRVEGIKSTLRHVLRMSNAEAGNDARDTCGEQTSNLHLRSFLSPFFVTRSLFAISIRGLQPLGHRRPGGATPGHTVASAVVTSVCILRLPHVGYGAAAIDHIGATGS